MDRQNSQHQKLTSHIVVHAREQTIWKHITKVQIEQFKNPWYFRLLDIPKPVRAEITTQGEGGRRIAYFANGKRFIQQILEWNEPRTYAFTFVPKPPFRVGWLFDLAGGPFQLISGVYHLNPTDGAIKLELQTTYKITNGWKWLLSGPIRLVLKLFQRYLLQSIKHIAEADSKGN